MFLFGHMGLAAAPAAPFLKSRKEREAAAGDMRWLLAGTLVPDAVDKSIGQLLFKSHYENGRIYCHTMLFASACLVLGGRRLAGRGDDRLFFLSLGVWSHLLLDKIWAEPQTAFWPALGHFLKEPSPLGILEQLLVVLKDPFFWLGEGLGLVLLLRSLRRLEEKDGLFQGTNRT